MIKAVQKNPGVNVGSLAEQFQYGTTQAAGILKKESLLSMYKGNFSTVQVKIFHVPLNILIALFDWFKLACSKNIYPGGPQLVEKARQIVAALGKNEFKDTNGWLERWETRYNVKRFRVCGESGDVLG